ncbi:MAG: hypothetical protein HOI88_01500 [Phycisphaerae bacterium]|jgi:murein tripeptide amidase MpaA|nr:hypothetical protein [Phycisphaerae bacterium]
MMMFQATVLTISTLFAQGATGLALGLTLDQGPTNQYDGLSIVNARIESHSQLQQLRDAGVQPLTCFDHEGPTPMLFTKEHYKLASSLRIEINVLEPSVEKYLENFSLLRAESKARGIGGWYSDFKTWGEVNTKLSQIESTNPNIATMITVGTTHEGRSIHGIRITAPGDASSRKQILWNGCQHAREWVAVMVPMYIIDGLVDGWYNDDEIRTLLEKTEVIIVPIVNPDGYEFTYATGGNRFWRKNRRNNSGSCEGVDLNRNWGYEWNGGDSTSNDTCSDVYVGPGVFSEPETQAMRDLVNQLPNLVAHIDFHSYSQLVLEPWASSNNTPPRENIVKALSGKISDAIASIHGETYVAGTGGDLLYLADGVFPDWVTNIGALSYTIELRPTGSPGFDLPPEQILPTCEESFAGAMEMLRFVNTPISFSFPSGTPILVIAGEIFEFPVHIESIFADEIIENSALLHVRYGDEGVFAQRPITYVEGTEFEVALPVSLCGLQSEYWISVKTTDGETHRYPQGSETLQAGVASEVMQWNMNTNPGWTTSGQWAWGTPSGNGGEYGNPDPTSGVTGQNVYGYNLGGDYANNLQQTHLTTGSIDVSDISNLQLTFARYLNVEQPVYDHAYVSARVDNGAWTTVWSNTLTIEDNSWQTVLYDLSEIVSEGSSLQIRWTMGETDGAWRYSGWNIDDVQLLSTANSAIQGDVNCDGLVNVTDVLDVVSNWGACVGVCNEDIVPDGTIGVGDLLTVIGNW